MTIRHHGFAQFAQGTFGNGGDNLFVDADGVVRRIMDNDLNHDGRFDLVLPNSHGYVERAPTEIFTLRGGQWHGRRLPQDSGWMPRVIDVDGDGHPDLLIANGENGVGSELPSYIHWGGPKGLTGDVTTVDTIGAYDVAFCDLTGNGLLDVLFTTAWVDHHNPGKPLWQKVLLQTAPRRFSDATRRFKIPGIATTSLLCEDLNRDGFPDLVLANRRLGHDPKTDAFVFFGSGAGFDPDRPLRLPTHGCTQVLAADLRGDGWKDLVFACSDLILVYRNDRGRFDRRRCERIDAAGSYTQFAKGLLAVEVADIDGDGRPEVLIGMRDGIEIRKADRLDRLHHKIECYGCSALKAADIHDRGRPDLIASHYCSQKSYDTESRVFWNTGDGFDPAQSTAFPTHGPMGCTAADFDQDGVKEIIFCNTMSGPSQYDPEFPVFVYFGSPDSSYAPEHRREYPVPLMSHTYVAADVDNDGFVELILTGAHGVRIFKGTAQGPDPEQYTDLAHPLGDALLVGGVMAGDFNRDGWLDLIMSPWIKSDRKEVLDNSVFVYFGGPDGYSQARRCCLPADVDSSQCILLADIDNDGYVDFLFGSRAGYIGVYPGGPDGFELSRFYKIRLKDPNGAKLFRMTAVDIDQDGWLELFVTTAGHYTRQASHLYLLRDAANGYPPSKARKIEVGGTTGLPSFADMTGDGNLDLLLPFYSTSTSRELPARIFKGNGKGDFDWEHPVRIDCPSSIALLPVDLDGKGRKDLFVCCHRNDLGHIVHSKLIRNGPEGLDLERARDILGYGPHGFAVKDPGNTLDRSDAEYYTSPVFACHNAGRLGWEGDTPHRTGMDVRVRFGPTPEAVKTAAWSPPVSARVVPLTPPPGSRYLQYRIGLHAPGWVNSPRLRAVTIGEYPARC